jgi:hypothetical protein
MDKSDEQCANARFSIRRRFDSDSKATEDSFGHWQKASVHRISTDDGMRIEKSEQQLKNADFSRARI